MDSSWVISCLRAIIAQTVFVKSVKEDPNSISKIVVLAGVRKMPYDEPNECPLCMEPLDIDDLNFYPCTCGYQICRFCWHRIRTDENSLCPACRKHYSEDPAEFKPLTDEELTKIKKERRQKDVARKQKAAENRRHLANIRVVQKNLVFAVGLSERLSNTEVLKRHEYFGKYGKIVKVVINSSTSYAGAQGPSASAYITYTRPEDCLRAINAVNNLYVDGRTLKASLGTTKYCSHFLKGTQCTKTDCMYLHELGDGEASFTKEEMQSGKHQDYEQKLVDTYLTPAPSTNLATQLSTSSSRSATGDGTNIITNGPSKANRKKTDSGSSVGSNKAKEPWPMLNSNNITSNNSTTSNGTIGSGGGKNSSTQSGVTTIAGTTTTTTVTSSVSTDRDPVITNSAGSPGNHRVKSNHSPSDHSSNSVNHNGLSHSSPSSTCSSTSNPRTPTPETSASASPRLSQTITNTEDTVTNSRTHTATTTSTVQTDPTSSATTNSSTLLAVRKLPFSETESDTLPDTKRPHPGDNTKQCIADKDFLLGNDNLKPHNQTGFPGIKPDTNQLPSIPASAFTSWQSNVPLSDNTASTLASDDDLGFDPFLESNKGLQDMLENEGNGVSISQQHRISSPLAGFGLPMHRPPPGVAPLPHLMPGAHGLFNTGGIIPGSIVPMSSSVSAASAVSSTSATMPPPPPGLSLSAPGLPAPGLPGFPQSFPHNSVPNRNGPELPGFSRGSRMLGLMNLGAQPGTHSQTLPHMMPQSPVNTMPRSPYNDSRLNSIQPPPQNQGSFPGSFPNGMSDFNNFNTQDLRESLKALLPNASINFAPGIPSHQPTQLQHSRLRNSYMQPPTQNSSSWGDSISQQPTSNAGNGSLDDQFSDPAIVSGCLSSTDSSNSPPTAQPHWLRSIQQLTENDSSPVKPPPMSSQQQQHIGQPHPLTMPPFRQPQTHSRMPFAQNIHMNQPGSGWPTLQPHNPPPGFQQPFRSSTQNPHMATLES